MYTLILRRLSVGLVLAFTVRPAGAVRPDTAKDEVAETQEPEDVDLYVESPISNPEIAEPLALDAGNFVFAIGAGLLANR